MTSNAHGRKPFVFGMPEAPLAMFAFLLHFVWEMLQAPFWESMMNMTHWEGVRVCAIATLGDVVIALVAFWSAAAVARSRAWIVTSAVRSTPVVVFIVVGLVITVLYEYLAVEVLNRWRYADGQPRLPIIGTGLLPVLQWLVIPPVTLWLTRTHLWGCARDVPTSS